MAATSSFGRQMKRFFGSLHYDTLPLIAAMSAASAFGTWYCYKLLAAGPDIRVNANTRKTTIVENFDEGKKYYDSFFHHHARASQDFQVFTRLNNAMSGGKPTRIIYGNENSFDGKL
eukprot:TRINITY_DN4132_c0_g2_i2.p2 TRINITY_DN4132_c0_g2~~TRINITY_DN4132_c0_g2_i2.p2  ORF type:complete len:117 (-),score=49.06 TRINITY_DN4132_c0_g2_i2:232-582(-)